MAGLRADLAVGQVEDTEGRAHNVTVAVLIGPQGIAWQSREAWGVGPGSALRASDELENLQGDIEEAWPGLDIDWSVIEMVRSDMEDVTI